MPSFNLSIAGGNSTATQHSAINDGYCLAQAFITYPADDISALVATFEIAFSDVYSRSYIIQTSVAGLSGLSSPPTGLVTVGSYTVDPAYSLITPSAATVQAGGTINLVFQVSSQTPNLQTVSVTFNAGAGEIVGRFSSGSNVANSVTLPGTVSLTMTLSTAISTQLGRRTVTLDAANGFGASISTAFDLNITAPPGLSLTTTSGALAIGSYDTLTREVDIPNNGITGLIDLTLTGATAKQFEGCTISPGSAVYTGLGFLNGSTTKYTVQLSAPVGATSGSQVLSCAVKDNITIFTFTIFVFDETPSITNSSPAYLTRGQSTFVVRGLYFGPSPTLILGATEFASTESNQDVAGNNTSTFTINVPLSTGTSLQMSIKNTKFKASKIIPSESLEKSPRSPISVYDNTPVINSVVQSTSLTPGGQTYITIYGAHLGNSGSLQICTIGTSNCSDISSSTAFTYGFWSDTQINSLLSASSSTPPGEYDIQVAVISETSGMSFQPAPQAATSAKSNRANGVTVSCLPGTVKITSRPIQITNTGDQAGSPYPYTATLTSQVSTPGGTYTWTTDNPGMVQFSGSGSTIIVGVNHTNDHATISLSYRAPCATSSVTDSFIFALTNDTTAVAWVDASKIRVPDPGLVLDLNNNPSTLPIVFSNPVVCAALVSVGWPNMGATGVGRTTNGLSSSEIDYSNSWLFSNSGNAPPPDNLSSLSRAVILNTFDYRLFQRFQASYEVINGKIQPSTVHYLQSFNPPGFTPDPCTLLHVPAPVELGPSNDLKSITSAQDGILQVSESRLGSIGQKVNQFLNGIAGNPWQNQTAFIWMAIQFDKDGYTQMLSQGDNIQIFPSYLVYSGESLLWRVQQRPEDEFIRLDSSSKFSVR